MSFISNAYLSPFGGNVTEIVHLLQSIASAININTALFPPFPKGVGGGDVRMNGPKIKTQYLQVIPPSATFAYG